MIKAVEAITRPGPTLPREVRGRHAGDRRAVGLGAAVDYLAALGMDAVRAHELELTAYALERLGALAGRDGLRARGSDERGGVVSFTIEGIHPHDLAAL